MGGEEPDGAPKEPELGRRMRRYVASMSRAASESVGDAWKGIVAAAPGVRVVAQTRRNVTFDATDEAVDSLRSALGAGAIVELVLDYRIPRPPLSDPSQD